MGSWTYLAVLVGCLLVTLPLELVLGARVYRRAAVVARSLSPVIVAYVAWDLLGIARDHWWYSPDRVVGVWFGPVPLEELLFFLVVPLCGLLSYEAVGSVLSLAHGVRRSGLRRGAARWFTRRGQERSDA